NLAMLGATADVADWIRADPQAATRICVATDSRLTGSRDLLHELRVARDGCGVGSDDLLPMVTTTAAAILRADAGVRRVGAQADFIVVPAAGESASTALLAADRASLRCVVIGGQPIAGHPATGAMFEARRVPCAAWRVDGQPKIVSRS